MSRPVRKVITFDEARAEGRKIHFENREMSNRAGVHDHVRARCGSRSKVQHSFSWKLVTCRKCHEFGREARYWGRRRSW